MDLDPWEALPERRDVLVGEAERGHPYQHQLPLEALGGSLAREHRGRRDEPRVVVRREVDPHGAVRVGGDRDVPDTHRAHAPVALDRERGRAGSDPEHSMVSPGTKVSPTAPQREPPEDPARALRRGEERVPGRAGVDVGHAAEGSPVAADVRRRVLREPRRA